MPSEALQWRKSSASDQSECVEVAVTGDSVHIRDSKDPTGPVLRFTAAEWRAFLVGVGRGEFRTQPPSS